MRNDDPRDHTSEVARTAPWTIHSGTLSEWIVGNSPIGEGKFPRISYD
jgi:hypothetical protein